MIARSESWSPQADPLRVAVAATLAVAVFMTSWTLLHHGFYRRLQVEDTPVYQRYGNLILHGHPPYGGFPVEYPPAALPVFVLPAVGHAEEKDFFAYERAFETLMALCGAAALASMAIVLRALRAPPRRLAAALVFTALAPLALGTVVLSRYDLWPAAITVAALAALLGGRERLGLATLGLGVAAKLYPAVLLPLALAYVWRRLGRREALVCAAVFAGVLIACFLPFVVLWPHGVWASLARQTTRPLQIESLGSGLLLAAHHVLGWNATMVSSHGSQNLGGGRADAAGALLTVLQGAALVAVWALFARGPADGERLVRASAAAVCAFVALAKVLSPQFLIWLLPLVPLVRGRRGVAASALLASALVLTQVWFPFRYWRFVFTFDPTVSWLILARDLVLVTLLAVLVWPERRTEAAPLGSTGG